jgi:hypothetical protein
MYTAATAAYECRISGYVRTYYAKILETVARGRFSVTFDFVCDDEDDRVRLLTKVIDRLKMKFKDVLFSANSSGHEFEVAWGGWGNGFTRNGLPAPLRAEGGALLSDMIKNGFTPDKCIGELDNTPLDIGKFGVGMKGGVGLKVTLEVEDK